jgi:protein-S-isoprenylcysteine O-methyltransferase Ste14
MKLIMVLGGLIGFSIGLGFGWAQRSPWPSIVWRAALAALLAGLLLRWWGRLWMQCLRQAQRERQAAAKKTEASDANAKASGVRPSPGAATSAPPTR